MVGPKLYGSVAHSPKTTASGAASFLAVLRVKFTLRRDSILRSSFQSHLADAADNIVGGLFVLIHGDYFDGRGLVVGAQD
jgi:hypothetical protein